MKDVFDQTLERLRVTPTRLTAPAIDEFIARGRAAQQAVDLAIGSGRTATAVDTSVSDERRACECCGRKLRASSRADRRTCSHRCRQKLWRKNAKTREASHQLSRKPVVARHVLSTTARSRAAIPDDAAPVPIPTETTSRTRRAFVSGRISGKAVRID